MEEIGGQRGELIFLESCELMAEICQELISIRFGLFLPLFVNPGGALQLSNGSVGASL